MNSMNTMTTAIVKKDGSFTVEEGTIECLVQLLNEQDAHHILKSQCSHWASLIASKLVETANLPKRTRKYGVTLSVTIPEPGVGYLKAVRVSAKLLNRIVEFTIYHNPDTGRLESTDETIDELETRLFNSNSARTNTMTYTPQPMPMYGQHPFGIYPQQHALTPQMATSQQMTSGRDIYTALRDGSASLNQPCIPADSILREPMTLNTVKNHDYRVLKELDALIHTSNYRLKIVSPEWGFNFDIQLDNFTSFKIVDNGVELVFPVSGKDLSLTVTLPAFLVFNIFTGGARSVRALVLNPVNPVMGFECFLGFGESDKVTPGLLFVKQPTIIELETI